MRKISIHLIADYNCGIMQKARLRGGGGKYTILSKYFTQSHLSNIPMVLLPLTSYRSSTAHLVLGIGPIMLEYVHHLIMVFLFTAYQLMNSEAIALVILDKAVVIAQRRLVSVYWISCKKNMLDITGCLRHSWNSKHPHSHKIGSRYISH